MDVTRLIRVPSLKPEVTYEVRYIVGTLDSMYLQLADPKVIHWIQDKVQEIYLDPVLADRYHATYMQLKKGDLICALWPQDNNYYRAIVLETSPLTVRFMDYGNCDVINEAYLLDPSLAKIPQQSVHCRLAYAEGVNGLSPHEISNALAGKELFGVFTPNQEVQGPDSPPFTVDLTLKVNVVDYLSRQDLSFDSQAQTSLEDFLGRQNQEVESGVSNVGAFFKNHLAKQRQLVEAINSQTTSDYSSIYSQESSLKGQEFSGQTLGLGYFKLEVGKTEFFLARDAPVMNNLFYIHPANSCKEFEAFASKLDFVSKEENSCPNNWIDTWKKNPKELMIASDKEKKLFRIEVVSIDETGDKVNVFAVDYGVTFLCSSSTIRPIPEQVKLVPKMAIPCTLANIRMEDPSSLDFGDLMRALLGHTKNVLFAKNVNKIPLEVSVQVNYNGKVVCLNRLLVEKGLAVPCQSDGLNNNNSIKNKDQESKEDNQLNENVLSTWQPMTKDFESIRNRYDYRSDDVDMVTKGYKLGNPKQKICKFFRYNGRCFSGNDCENFHGDPDQLNVDNRSINLQLKLGQTQFPKPDSVIKVNLAEIKGPEDFWCTLPYQFIDFSVLKTQEELKEEVQKIDFEFGNLKQLSADMNAHYRHVKFLNFNFPPYIGEIVAVTNQKGHWYRARIFSSDSPEFDDESEYDVFLVDFGQTWRVGIRQMRRIELQFLHLPGQAYSCCLAGLDGPKTRDRALAFRSLVQDRQIMDAKVVKVDNANKIHLDLLVEDRGLAFNALSFLQNRG